MPEIQNGGIGIAWNRNEQAFDVLLREIVICIFGNFGAEKGMRFVRVGIVDVGPVEHILIVGGNAREIGSIDRHSGLACRVVWTAPVVHGFGQAYDHHRGTRHHADWRALPFAQGIESERNLEGLTNYTQSPTAMNNPLWS